MKHVTCVGKMRIFIFTRIYIRILHGTSAGPQICILPQPRIVNVWNSLPEIVISADTTDTFRRRLDKFWQHQDILYDYKVELTGVENRSQINSDDNIVI